MSPIVYKAYVAHGYIQTFIHASSDRGMVEWMAYLVGGVVHEYNDGELVDVYRPNKWGQFA